MREKCDFIIPNRRRAGRALASIPLVLAAATVSISLGVAPGSATSTGADVVGNRAVGASEIVAVRNVTDQSMVGEWHIQDGGGVASIDFRTPLQPGEQRSASVKLDVVHKLYVWGRVCYNHTWWNLPRAKYEANHDDVRFFTLRADYYSGHLEAVGASVSGEAVFPLSQTESGTACNS